MIYRSLRECANDLERSKQLIRIKTELDPDLEIAEVHRRIFEAGGPALLFERVKGSPFQAISNVYGTFDRTRFLFRDTMEKVQKVIELKRDPSRALKNPLRYAGAPFTALTALPRKAWWSKPAMYGTTTIDQLPQIKSWPMDGGAFITMPQVFSEDPDRPSLMNSNLGMYRIQLSGNDYIPNEEIGLHYQLHRGIGVHHTRYNETKKSFKVSIFVGGLPSHAFSAIMPLPEGLSELTFAGLLAGRRFRYTRDADGYIVSTDADFVITGEIMKDTLKSEGPFGDHLGYYSLAHPFPVMKVNKVYHRQNPLWHFSVVGRPPMEDSSFGYLIHELVKELAPQEFPGLIEMHAVDAAGVHPLLLAIGSERYMPFRERKPEEILAIGNRILGSGQTSLAKYLIIAANGDVPNLDTHDIAAFFRHVLERIDWTRDLHFHTRTTIDTLDYSGEGWNAGSKVIMAACGAARRQLATELPSDLRLPQGYHSPSLAQAGVLAVTAPKFSSYENAATEVEAFCAGLSVPDSIPLVILCDDAPFCAATLNNFVWVAFTRSNPSHDIYGVGASTVHKHWGCKGALVIDARIKPHHAPELIPDAKVSAKVDKLFAKGGELYGVI